jgi:catechol 2,3-dioxygenase-like lactoylglutathione lyase family enzyme
MDWKLEVVSIPVSDVDRAIAFYTDQIGFHLDHDHPISDRRFVNACAVQQLPEWR